MIREHNNKPYTRFNKAHDINGNPVIKVFYPDGTTEIIRGSNAYTFPHGCDKYYKSLSGLYKSR